MCRINIRSSLTFRHGLSSYSWQNNDLFSPFHFPLCSIFKMYLLDHEFPFYLLNLPLVSIWKLKIESLLALFSAEKSRLLIAASRTPCFSHRVSLIHQVTVCQKANNFRKRAVVRAAADTTTNVPKITQRWSPLRIDYNLPCWNIWIHLLFRFDQNFTTKTQWRTSIFAPKTHKGKNQLFIQKFPSFW